MTATGDRMQGEGKLQVRAIVPLALSASISILAGPALSCSPPVYELVGNEQPDEEIVIRQDCSFSDDDYSSHDGKSFGVRRIAGSPVRDRGNGRIAQRLDDGVCGANETLLFVDCSTGEAAIVWGVERRGATANDQTHGADSLIKFIQPPNGPVSIGPDSTVNSVVDTARSAGFLASRNVEAYLNDTLTMYLDGTERIGKRRRFRTSDDTYPVGCGCKLFYPNSPGAGGAGG